MLANAETSLVVNHLIGILFVLSSFFTSLDSIPPVEYSFLASRPEKANSFLVKNLLATNKPTISDIISVNFYNSLFLNETTLLSPSPGKIISVENVTHLPTTLFQLLTHFYENPQVKFQKFAILLVPVDTFETLQSLKSRLETEIASLDHLHVLDLNTLLYIAFFMQCAERFNIWEIYSIKSKLFLKHVEIVPSLNVWMNERHDKRNAMVERENWEGIPFTAAAFVDFQVVACAIFY